MRIVVFFVVALAFISLAPAGFAQGYGDQAMAVSAKGDVASTLETLEHKVNDAFQKQDSKTFLSMIDPNAWSVDAMGFTPVSELAGMLKDIVIKHSTIEGYKVAMIDKDVYVATFTWKGDGAYKGEAVPPITYCSTVWAKRGKEWKAVFHQESIPMPEMQQSAAGSR
jgi:hypothetical protein